MFGKVCNGKGIGAPPYKHPALVGVGNGLLLLLPGGAEGCNCRLPRIFFPGGHIDTIVGEAISSQGGLPVSFPARGSYDFLDPFYGGFYEGKFLDDKSYGHEVFFAKSSHLVPFGSVGDALSQVGTDAF